MNTHTLLIPALAVGLIIGIAPGSILADPMDSQDTVTKVQVKFPYKQRGRNTKLIHDAPKGPPFWVDESVPMDGTGFYGIGTGTHESMEIAVGIAQLSAGFDVARAIKSHMSRLSEITVNGDEDYLFILATFVTRTKAVGSETVREEVYVVPEGYRAFSMAKLPFTEFERVLSEQPASVGKDSVKHAYQWLVNEPLTSKGGVF